MVVLYHTAVVNGGHDLNIYRPVVTRARGERGVGRGFKLS